MAAFTILSVIIVSIIGLVITKITDCAFLTCRCKNAD